MAHSRMQTIRRVAQYLANQDRYVWQVAPNWQQQKKQDRYIRKAMGSINIVEEGLADFKWMADSRPLPDREPQTPIDRALAKG